MLLAHSAKPEKCIPTQSYTDHIDGVLCRATDAAKIAARYAAMDGDLLEYVVRWVAEFHDLGKLDPENQKVLSGKLKAKHLPVQHTDAGTAFLWNKDCPLCAVLARSHHIGLPDFVEEKNRPEESIFRDDSVRGHVNQTLPQLLDDHRKEVLKTRPECCHCGDLSGDASLYFRLALSCLADGDHSDTAFHYREYPRTEKIVKLKAKERLATLDRYVIGLAKRDDERTRLRSAMYQACRNAAVKAGISSCDSPVGTGKTTAVMAHLLAQAERRGLRRIFVVLPFTNIIAQSVGAYRKALTLPGENPEEVVAELHHRADFQSVESRHLTALWKAPIVVTTAVSFFETMASNTPSTLRRLHNLPGSAVFVDESHAALPAKLLPIAWHWMKCFADEWKCYWVLASGSLNRFWQIPEFDKDPLVVPEVVSCNLREKLSVFEAERITYRYKKEPQNVEGLVEWLVSLPGPRIIIVNTVQSAAVIAQEYAKKCGRENVEHLSTALTPKNRADALDRVKTRLHTEDSDTEWVLVATSCIEAGVDISFRTGIREIGSLVSLLQTAGRVKRHGESEESDVWSIRLAEGGLLKFHPGLKDSAKILFEYCKQGTVISPALCTDALKREIRLAGSFMDRLSKKEATMRFPQVENEFRVINTDTRLAVVEKELIDRLEKYETVSWRELQKGSVQIWGYRLDSLSIPEIRNGVYKWIYPYDSFLGYMAGILPVIEYEQFNGAII